MLFRTEHDYLNGFNLNNSLMIFCVYKKLVYIKKLIYIIFEFFIKDICCESLCTDRSLKLYRIVM